MNPPRRFTWELPQERVDMLAQMLYLLHDVAHRLVPGCSLGENAYRLLNDLRAQIKSAGGEDPFPFWGYDMVFPDTCVPAWPDPKDLRIEGIEAARER